MKTKDEFFKVVGIGETDYEFNLNLTETELVLYKIDPESLNSVSDLIPLLKIKELKEKLYISSNNNLLNIFLFLNKTNPQKTFVEYVSLNCMMVNPENFFMKEKMIKELEENCMFLIEANLLPPTKIKINLNIPNRPTKLLEMEFTSNDYIYDKAREEKDRLEAEQYRKMELERSLQKTHASAKKNEPQKEQSFVKKETTNFNKKNDEISKKEDLQNKYKEITNEIKNELKKDENKKNEEKKQEVKKDESKVDDKNNENKKEEKKSDVKNEETKDSSKNQEGKKDENKPKTGNHIIDKISLNLPVPQREQSRDTRVIYPEGKDENDQRSFRSDKTTILISSKSKSNIPAKNVNLLDLKYDFSNCNYIFVDLNYFLRKIGDISSIYEFLNTRLVQNFSITGIITICPSEDLITEENCSKIINFLKISDIVLYEMKNVKKITSILGYKMENEEFEKKFCELNELQLVKTNNRQNRISLFLDDFSKFTIINQNKESGLVTLVKEFKFEIGLKLEYFNSIYHNFISLKNAFLSGFFSRLIQNYNYETAFFVGNETFKKTLDIFFNNKEFPRDDPDYFIVFTKKPAAKKELRKDKYVNRVPKRLANNININVFNINDKKSDFVLDGPNLLKSRLKEYNPLFDENLSSYFTSPFILKHLNKMGFIDRTGSVADHKTIKNLGLKVNNKKFLMKKLESEQKKLIKYIQKGEQKSLSPNKSMNKSEEEPENVIYPRIQSNYSVKLPSLNPKTRQYSFENKKEFFAGNKIAEINKLQEHSVTLNLKNINRNFGGKINKNNKLPLLTESMKVNDISFDNYNDLSENLEGNNSLRDDINQNNSKNLNKLTRQLVKYQIEADNPFPKEQSFAESDYKNYYNSSSNDYSYKSPVKSNFNYELNELSTMRSEKLKSEVLKDLSKYSYKEGSSSKKKKKERLNDLAERHKYTYLEGKEKDFSFVKMSGKEITSKEDINKSSMRTNERDYHEEVRRDVNFMSNEKADGGGIYVPRDIEQIKRMEMENEKIQKQKDAERDAALQIYLENKRKEELRRIEEAKQEEQRRLEEKKRKELEELKKKEEDMRKYEEEKRKAEEDRKKAQEEERKRIEEEKKKKESKKEEVKKEDKKTEEKKEDKKVEEKNEDKKGEEKKEEKKAEEKKAEEKKDDKKTEEKKAEEKK